jgi:hypothetical protein
MESEREDVVQITLTMNEEEAVWLRGFVQNPHCQPNLESGFERQTRESLFIALRNCLE